MIHTVTLNLALDYYLSDKYTESKIYDSKNILSQKEQYINLKVGGKGINVSKVLSDFAIESNTFGFISYNFKDFVINDINKYMYINNKLTDIENLNRLNIKLYNELTTDTKEINGMSPLVNITEQQNLINSLLNNVKQNDVLVLSGSLPEGLSQDFYKQIAKLIPKSVKIVLDTRGNLILKNIYNTFLIKPNIEELSEMFSTEFINNGIVNYNLIVNSCRDVLTKQVKHIIVSLGKYGSLYINNNEVFIAQATPIMVLNTVGAGDSMVAGFISALIKNKSNLECYRTAVAGSLATVSSGNLANINNTEQFKHLIKIIPYDSTHTFV